MASYGYWSGEPGSTAAIFNTESNIFWGSGNAVSPAHNFITISITSAAVDTGSPTTILRPGLILGKITSSGMYTNYSPTATDGSQQAVCVLPTEINMLDPVTGTVANRVTSAVINGPIKASACYGLDNISRAQLEAQGVLWDDTRGTSVGLSYIKTLNKAASYTVLATDNNTLFTASAAATFTLPTIAAGLHFEFYNLANTDMAVTSAEGTNIVTDGNASASTLTFSTASHKIGGGVEVIANSDATKWITRFKGAAPANVVTVT